MLRHLDAVVAFYPKAPYDERFARSVLRSQSANRRPLRELRFSCSTTRRKRIDLETRPRIEKDAAKSSH